MSKQVHQKRMKPQEVTFLHFFRKPRPKGWCEKKIYSLGITDCRLRSPCSEWTDAAKEAHSFFYPGFKEPHYPHILCLTRDPLFFILMGIYRMKGLEPFGEDDPMTSKVDQLIRPTWGYVNGRETHAVPTGESRSIWPGKNHKVHDKEKIPKAVKLFRSSTFDRLRKSDPLCFLTAFGLGPPS